MDGRDPVEEGAASRRSSAAAPSLPSAERAGAPSVGADGLAEGLLLALPEPALLVTSAGVILRANAAAAALLGAPPAALREAALADYVADARDAVARYLAACARTRSPMPGALHLRPSASTAARRPAGPARRSVTGAVVRPASPASPALVLLRVRVDDGETGDRFALLSRQVDELTREVRLRRAAEAALRDANARLQDQALEVEAANQQLQEQAAEVEMANEELQATAEALEDRSAAAEAAEQRTRALIASVTDPVIAYDRDWRMVYLNEPARAILRDAGVEDPAGRILWEATPTVRGTDIERGMRRAMASGAPGRFEWQDRSGSWIEVRTYPLGDGLLAYWTDVTAARRERERTELLAESSAAFTDALHREDALRAVLGFCAQRMADFCSMHLVEPEGALRLVDVVHRDPERAALARAIEARWPLPPDAPVGAPAVIRSGRPSLQRELPWERVRLAARDAEHLAFLERVGMVSTIVVPLAARGRVLGALTLVSAESGRRYDEQDLALAEEIARRAALVIDNARLYAEAEDARRRAEEANRSKSQFLASMSHELRTPLNAIAGHVALIGEGVYGPVTDAQREALGRVQRAQRHLLGLINDVLNYAKLDAGRVTYDMQAVLARDVLADVLPMLQPQIAAKGHAVETDLPEDRGEAPVFLWADREKLAQVLLNLLSNAVKFTPAGGRIRVASTAGEAPGGRPVRVRITVSDTGPGIPRERLPQIFEPFTQVGRALNRPVEGTGLGLSISRDLAQGMGGDLTADSTLGVGSTFTLELSAA